MKWIIHFYLFIIGVYVDTLSLVRSGYKSSFKFFGRGVIGRIIRFSEKDLFDWTINFTFRYLESHYFFDKEKGLLLETKFQRRTKS